MRRLPRRADEQGAFIVLYALLVLGLFAMLAIVIDLSALRQDRRADRLAADAAAMAGAADLPTSARAACTSAWNYAARNLGFTPPAAPCSGFPAAVCSSATPINGVGTLGAYTVTIRNPVDESDPMMDAEKPGADTAQTLDTSRDGSSTDDCERIGVEISRTRTSLFGKVVGHGNDTTNVHSVGRSVLGGGGVHPNFVVLEPHGCDAMSVVGNAGIEVVGSGSLQSAIVIVDDGANCTGVNNWVLDTGNGNDNSHIAAVNGDIYIKAGGGLCGGNVCDPDQLDVSTCRTDSPPTCFGYYPAPQPLTQDINRSRIDYLWDCNATYAAPTHYRTVTVDGVLMDPCPGATGSNDYVNRLYKQVVTNNGLQLSTYGTTIGPSPPPPGACPSPLPIPATGSVRFNCTIPSGASFTVNGDALFTQGSWTPGNVTIKGNAIFRGALDITSTVEVDGNAYFVGNVDVRTTAGKLIVHGATGATYPASCAPATFTPNIATCVRSSGYSPATVSPPAQSSGAAFAFFIGYLKQTNGGVVSFDRVMVYGGPSSTVTLSGGDIIWLPPTTGPFKKLAFWSDATGVTHTFQGGGALTVDGVFFAPEAAYKVAGGSSITPQDAQFWALSITGVGDSTLQMTPDPDSPSLPLQPSVRLIR